MNESEHEETLSLSLVDGITCGLASALLLLIVFGINMTASTATLGGTSGRGTTNAKLGDMANEPVDIVVEVEGPTTAVEPGTGWKEPYASGTNDGDARDASGNRWVFTREIAAGFRDKAIKGAEAPVKLVSFVLNWNVQSKGPHGTVYIFRSGNETSKKFDCKDKLPPYDIIKSFDLVRASLKGDCSQEKDM